MAAGNSDLVDEQSERFYALYERRTNSFRRALIVVTGLLTVAFVLIFYPYVTFRGMRYTLETELQSLTRDLSAAERQAESGRWLLEGYSRLASQTRDRFAGIDVAAIERTAEEHDRQIAAIRRAAGGDPDLEPWLSGRADDRRLPPALERRYPELEGARDTACFWHTGRAWVGCVLDERIAQAYGEIIGHFARSRMVPVPRNHPFPEGLWVDPHLRNSLYTPVADSVSELTESFGAYLRGEAPDWQVDGEPVENDLREQHDRFLSAIRDLLTRHRDRIEEQVYNLSREERDLADERERVEEALNRTLARLDGMKGLQNIQTPFGPLPIGLNELVLLFPVLLAGGFVLCASLFADSLELRREYHRLARLKDPGGGVLDDARIGLAAPVWIDPLQPPLHRIYRAAILALPVALFVAALALLADNLFFGPFMAEARLGSAVYLGLYGVSALAVLEGCRRIHRALRAYPRNL